MQTCEKQHMFLLFKKKRKKEKKLLHSDIIIVHCFMYRIDRTNQNNNVLLIRVASNKQVKVTVSQKEKT